jgi:hypothetical protein
MAFAKKMQHIIKRGVAEAKDLRAKGVLKMEIMQLRAHTGKLVSKLGDEVYTALADGNQATVSRDSPSIRDMLNEIKALRAENDRKEVEYRLIGVRMAVEPPVKP